MLTGDKIALQTYEFFAIVLHYPRFEHFQSTLAFSSVAFVKYCMASQFPFEGCDSSYGLPPLWTDFQCPTISGMESHQPLCSHLPCSLHPEWTSTRILLLKLFLLVATYFFSVADLKPNNKQQWLWHHRLRFLLFLHLYQIQVLLLESGRQLKKCTLMFIWCTHYTSFCLGRK